MKGIQFVVDEAGKKKAVLIDLEEWGELWEDFYDLMMAESRKHEASVDWHEVKAKLKKGATDTLIASESSLKKDWLRPEEDEAWQDL
jgi:hypothetical protein